MRLHHLSITAFGPFADPVEVDFDEVSAAGLFLIRGATGAGKTSILDAVCFALYAAVPGSRPSGRALRSDHASREAIPRVTLEFTAAGRRFRVERSPEFMRPKKRGAGETKAPARVVLHERVGGSWVGKDTRHDDVADVLREVLGMGLEQFSKVVLLPQGDFAAFLRATAEERRAVLERLFDISSFTGVEDWLAAQRRALADAIGEHQTALEADFARLSDALAEVPDGVLPDRAAWQDLAPERVPAELDRVHEALNGRAAQTLAALDLCTATERDAGRRLQEALQTTAHQARGAAASADLARLEAGQDAYDTNRARLEQAVKAQAVSGDLKALARARRSEEAARQTLEAARERLAPFGVGERSGEGLELWAEQVRAHDESLEEAGRLLRALSGKRERRDGLHDDAEAAGMAAAGVNEKLAAAQNGLGALEAEVSAAAAATASLDGLKSRAEAASRLHAVRLEHDAGLADQRSLADEISAARTVAQDAREHVLDLREARLAGMAGELAQRLADGDPCAVCGSLDHPAPAEHTAPVTASDIERAEAALSAAAGRLETLERKNVALEAAAAERERVLGGDQRAAGELSHSAQAAADTLAETAAMANGHAAAARRLRQAREAAGTLAQRGDELRAALLTARATLDELARDIAGDEGRLATLLRDHRLACPCAAETEMKAKILEAAALRRHREAVSILTDYLAADAAVADAERARQDTAESTSAALTESGFADADAARGAMLQADEAATLRGLCSEFERARTAAEAVLSDPAVQAVLQQPAPDVEALAAVAEAARAALLLAKDAETLSRRTLRDIERLRPGVAQRCGALGPALAEHALLCDLADTFSGAGPNNTLRMRLSSFVLAARLEKVAQLANERLAVMGDGRYRLEHSDGLAARGARSGLGLRVQDLWTGQSRDTTTLSGGEAFMASLALALGLADAVREEAGGLDLQTLFVDEGFGTLDDDSLEQVMGVLDSLREGGRAVGVVSHVAELRTRIPSQITVHKAERGSSVSVTTADESAPAA